MKRILPCSLACSAAGCTDQAPEYPNQEPKDLPVDEDFPPVPAECGQTATAQNIPLGSDYWYISPGYYTDFPQYNINGDKIVGNTKHIIMHPGIYCVGGDIRWSGTTFKSLDGSSGVTLYLKSGYDFNFNINSPIILNATSNPNSDYQGYLIVQEGTPANIGSCIINGGAYLDINGMIYAPYCNFTINGQAGETAVINAQIVGWDIKINGTNAINFNYDPDNQVKVKRKVGLMK